MAKVLCHHPPFPCVSKNVLICHFSLKPQESCLKWALPEYPSRHSLSFVCSAEKSSTKGKAARPAKSNDELCNELWEFISVVGLPENQVPSLKELAKHGRKDLANIVRRRGYKVIAELLMSSAIKGDFMKENCAGKKNSSSGCKDDGSDGAPEFHNKGMLDDVEHSTSCSEGAKVGLQHVAAHETVEHPKRDDVTSGEQLNGGKVDDNLGSDMDGKQDRQTEIDLLKDMLNQKEMELSQLKQRIEKEKHSLSILQAKATSEIGNAQRMILQKDLELRAAEEGLVGLKEVRIEFWTNGTSVEVAGSFNGWHQRIRMDVHPSSNLINPPGSRKSALWSTTLWLYPGTYEIKFIVDGQWTIDSQRETITSGHATNNVLRVDK